jgi:putative RNA 2'-phosphotransferase
MDRDRAALSKTISHALRHAPQQYGLQPDPQGWVSVDDLIDALRRKRRAWSGIDTAQLVRLNDEAEKRRFDIEAGRIRARYGHSLPRMIEREAERPPRVLYHGTAEQSMVAITGQGLQPMGRQHVHLSTDVQTALQVGRRRRGPTTVLEVDAAAANEAGIRFYRGNEDTWLAGPIPARFLRVREVARGES